MITTGFAEHVLFGFVFGTLIVSVVVGMVFIQIGQWRAAYLTERLRLARIEEFKGKCFRPDGD